MDIRNCKMCGRIYQYSGSNYCYNCLQELEEMFKRVRDYIDENPAANVVDVSEATDVEEKYILDFLREGRLELKEASPGLPCERCGRPIRSGRYCQDCIQDMTRELKKGLNEEANRGKDLDFRGHMHIADRFRKNSPQKP